MKSETIKVLLIDNDGQTGNRRSAFAADLLTNGALTLLVSQMQSLPSLPSLYMELMRQLESPEPSIKKIGAIISQDPGMTAKILQMVNSAFFGLRRHISNPAEATGLLGLDIIKAMVLSIHIFQNSAGHGFLVFPCKISGSTTWRLGHWRSRLPGQKSKSSR